MNTPPAEDSLFHRLGGSEGIDAIAAAVVARHVANPIIGERFAGLDLEQLARTSADFFNMGSGGPAQYQGRDMVTTHKDMNLDERDLVAAIDDVLAVLEEHGVEAGARAEVLAILYSLKGEVLFQ